MFGSHTKHQRTTSPSTKLAAAVARRPGLRGWRGRGQGEAVYVTAADEWRGTSVQVCGMWPFVGGSGTPILGVPIGVHTDTGAPFGADPISWFMHGMINNPSMFVLGLPHYGKSTLVRHIVLGLAGRGINPLILGDLKPDYVDLIEALGGQVISLGPGRGHLNVLDPGEATGAAGRLLASAEEHRAHANRVNDPDGDQDASAALLAAAAKATRLAEQLMADSHNRRLNMITALITIVRNAKPSAHEESLIDRALHILDERLDRVPLIGDLIEVIKDAPDELRAIALDRGDMSRYLDATDQLSQSLYSLDGSGRFSDMFSRPTDQPMDLTKPVVFDLSGISDTQRDIQAACLLACWSTGFATVQVAHTLADAGLEPRRNYFVVMDELWRALRSGEGMVDRVDSLTRLNRTEGVGQAMITHTMSDLEALPTESERMKARGFVERSGMVVCGALPGAEMEKLNKAVTLSRAEQSRLISWADPGSWTDVGGSRKRVRPGLGKFLFKVGGRPGVPVALKLTSVEERLHDTNKRWRISANPVEEN
ncbi:ATP/GTP-binding protein [Paenarthrobacter ureafaciens]|uniref:ATP/GTP-binding protein n=1 Tax=Paenarthrobacter ureafaciens TaxID=37931 RepID=UPI00292E61EB|nr:ATP/GTP-binding protein [Paenarthrobacter ureafaciens]WNZ02960.1 ATP/GTP-binding protein [Paenarthrobacter ureafaciens]